MPENSSLSTFKSWFSVVISTVTLISLIIAWATEFRVVKFQVSYLWKVVFENTLDSLERKGVVNTHSPYTVNDSIKDYLVLASEPACLKIYMDISTMKQMPKARSDRILEIIERIGWDNLLFRAREMKVPVSDYLLLWSIIIREAREVGVNKFLAKYGLSYEILVKKSEGRYCGSSEDRQ